MAEVILNVLLNEMKPNIGAGFRSPVMKCFCARERLTTVSCCFRSNFNELL